MCHTRVCLHICGCLMRLSLSMSTRGLLLTSLCWHPHCTPLQRMRFQRESSCLSGASSPMLRLCSAVGPRPLAASSCSASAKSMLSPSRRSFARSLNGHRRRQDRCRPSFAVRYSRHDCRLIAWAHRQLKWKAAQALTEHLYCGISSPSFCVSPEPGLPGRLG